MWCVTGEAIGSGLLKSIGACIPTPHAPEAALGRQDLGLLSQALALL